MFAIHTRVDDSGTTSRDDLIHTAASREKISLMASGAALESMMKMCGSSAAESLGNV
jgi:hypothetical protein